MKQKLILILLLAVIAFPAFAQKKKANEETASFRYEAEATTGQAMQGYTLVKVYSYSKDKNVALAQAGKNAVHAILFKGVAAYNDEKTRIPSQKPIIGDMAVYVQNQPFFDLFFAEGGDYQKYVQLVNNGIPDVGDIIKIGKEYKVGVKVLINKTALRTDLEKAGIINKLTSGF